MNKFFFRSLTLGTLVLAGAVACKKEQEVPVESAFGYTTVSTLAGNGTSGFTDGPGAGARFFGPEGVVVDAQGNVYVADAGNSSIRKITPSGTVSTLAGNGTDGFVNGSLAAARFDLPFDVALDGQGNLYVADYGNNCLRKITPAGVVSTLAGTGAAGFADGAGATAQFNGPSGLAIDGQGVIYVSDGDNNRIRKVMPNGTVSTLAGTGQAGFTDGPGSSAQLSSPQGLAIDAQGTLYITESGGYRIRKIAPNGMVSTLAGTGVRGYADGGANTAQFREVTGVALDAHGDLLVTDADNYCVRKVTPAGVVSTVAGTRTYGFADGPARIAQFQPLSGIAVGEKGSLYVTEYGERIRKITSN